MHIRGMTVDGIPPFTEPVNFEFDEQVNVFIGPNRIGKSTLLRKVSMTYEKQAGRDTHRMPLVWIGSTRIHFDRAETISATFIPGMHDNNNWRKVLSFLGPCIFYWVITSIILAIALVSLTVFTNTNLPSLAFQVGVIFIAIIITSLLTVAIAVILTLRRDFGWTKSRRLRALLDSADAVVYSASAFVDGMNLLESVNGEACSQVHNIAMGCRNSILQLDTSTGGVTDMGIDVEIESSGTQNVAAVIGYIALKIAYAYNFTDKWERMPALLLADEIENQLHPMWQRRVIPALLEHFPGLQIFATTHSPFVVAGRRAGQVHLLNRDDNGVITATTNTEDIVGWTADEILRTYMGVHDPTDDETASAAAELRKLLDEGPREDAQNEQERQDRMRELRVAVDTNVLSGPRVAEDERFAATLESILERYRQSTDLNQENG